MRTVEATVHTAFIFNTHLDFTELLRLVLNELGVATSAQRPADLDGAAQ